MSAPIEVQRLSDLDNWEFYQLIDTTDDEVLFTIGIRPYPEFQEVEYGVWSPDRDNAEVEPVCTGSMAVEQADPSWHDRCREQVITGILDTRQEGLGLCERRLLFRLDFRDDDPPSGQSGGQD